MGFSDLVDRCGSRPVHVTVAAQGAPSAFAVPDLSPSHRFEPQARQAIFISSPVSYAIQLVHAESEEVSDGREGRDGEQAHEEAQAGPKGGRALQ